MRDAQIITMEDYNGSIPDLMKIDGAYWRGLEYREELLLEYVTQLCDEVFLDYAPEESFINEDGEVETPAYISFGPNLFATRLLSGKLYASDTLDKMKERYLSNKELLDMLKVYHIDPVKFWYLLLFINDYAEDGTINAKTLQPSILDDISKLLEHIKSMNIELKYSSFNLAESEKKGSISISIGGRKKQLIENCGTIAFIGFAINSYLKNIAPLSKMGYDINSKRYSEIDKDVNLDWETYFTENLFRFIDKREKDAELAKYKYCSKYALASLSLYVVTNIKSYQAWTNEALKNRYRKAAVNLRKELGGYCHNIYSL